MPEHFKNNNFTPQEHLVSILPSVLAGIFLLLATTMTALLEYSPHNPVHRTVLLLYGVFGIIYLAFFYLLFISRSHYKTPFTWINSLLAGISLGLLTLILPDEMDVLLGMLMITAVISSSILSERGPAYLIVACTTTLTLIIRFEHLDRIHEWITHLSPAMIALIAMETIQQLKRIPRQQINRLQ